MNDDYVSLPGRSGSFLRYGGEDGERKVSTKLEIMNIVTDTTALPPKKFILPFELYRELKSAYLLDYHRSLNFAQIGQVELPEHIHNIPIVVETPIAPGAESANPVINRFGGDYFFLSNFYTVDIESHGLVFPSAEHLFQAWKTQDPYMAKCIREARNPTIAKKFGRSVLLRPDWDFIKLAVMRQIVFDKFWQNKLLAQLLDNTGNAVLVEGNTWGDRFWGTVYGEGENHLGRILMDVRQDLRRIKNA